MIGKVIGGLFKVVAKTLVAIKRAIGNIPVIGKPIESTIEFLALNLWRAIKRLPYAVVALVVVFVGLGYIGLI
jgi:hypothetical protein